TALNMEGGSLPERLYSITARGGAWLVALFGDGVSQDNIVFVLFLSILFWFLGHNTAWHIFRVDRVWRAILPPGLVIVVNVFYYTGTAPLGVYMALYAVLALLLVVRSNIDNQEWEWYRQHIAFPPELRGQFLRWGAVLAILLVGVAWVLPNGAENENLERIHEFLSSDPLEELNRLFNRLFASLDSTGLATADYYGGNSLQLGGAIQLGDQPVMLIDTTPFLGPGTRYYWRSRVFAEYNNGIWTPVAEIRLTVSEPGYTIEDVPAVPGSREPVQQRFTMVVEASRLVYAASQPVVLNLPAALDLTYVDEAHRQVDVSVIRPLSVLHTGDDYAVVSSVSVMDAPSLRSAGQDYPAWVQATYLQVGAGITQRTRDLAWQIVLDANALTPYDQAKAIEGWLRANIAYDETIPGAPPGVDPVDWVLFEDRRGYCNYYASAMIMMLRAVGVPARMAAGFSQGEWDNATQSFLVRERDAHTWVEVYFPNYGWVEFEPTVAQAPLDRPDAVQVAQEFPTITPDSAQSPTPTVTLTPTNTPPPTNTPQSTAQGDVPLIPPTATATLEPSVTPTRPVAPAAASPPNEETQSRSVLSVILSLVLAVLAVLLIVIILAVLLLLLVWWIEWRGLGGLSPVQRAYALLGRYAGYVGIRLGDSYTPHERRRILVDRVPRGEEPIRVITDMYVDETYGPERPRSEHWTATVRAALREARVAFLRTRLGRLFTRSRRGE
ncbi:MAG: transglutaminase domain-containing protein, partial [Anaerolineae bacterium]|nr:transglutaminase domain-containing protein [Anaerolineae bacterium]